MSLVTRPPNIAATPQLSTDPAFVLCRPSNLRKQSEPEIVQSRSTGCSEKVEGKFYEDLDVRN